jgi:hypothetical protein
VVVFVNRFETLSYSCDWCGRTPYAKKGTGQHEEWQQEITPFETPPHERTPQPDSAAPVVTSEEVATDTAPIPTPTPAAKQKGGLSWLP